MRTAITHAHENARVQAPMHACTHTHARTQAYLCTYIHTYVRSLLGLTAPPTRSPTRSPTSSPSPYPTSSPTPPTRAPSRFPTLLPSNQRNFSTLTPTLVPSASVLPSATELLEHCNEFINSTLTEPNITDVSIDQISTHIQRHSLLWLIWSGHPPGTYVSVLAPCTYARTHTGHGTQVTWVKGYQVG